MGLKILHSADWHLDSPFTGVSDAQRERLKEAQLRLPEMIADICLQEGCDLVLLAGDLFDGPYSRETAAILSRELARCAVPVFISPGNHDYLAPESPWLGEAWPENVHIFTGAMTSVTLPELDCRIYGAGYRSMDCPGLLQGFRAAGEERYQIALLHADPMQVHSPYCPVTAGQVRASGLTYLALGHIHKAGSFRAGGTLCAWPGTPMGRGFDETREKGVYIVSLEDGASCRFLELDMPRFELLEGEEGELDSLLPPLENDNFYRITLVGPGETPLDQIRSRLSRFPNLELVDRREAPRDIWESAGEDTLEGAYFRLLQEKRDSAPPELAEAYQLAAEISRKLLDGKAVSL